MKKIDFTVLIPVFNTKAAQLIEAAFSLHHENQSIDQEYDILIIDDGSTLYETQSALEFLKTYPNIKVHHMAKNGGTSAALNKGHKLIKTEWIAISGSSDISFKDRFKIQCDHLNDHPEIDVLGTNLFSFLDADPFRKPIYTSSHKYITTLQERTEGWLTNHGTVIYKNDSVKKVGGYQLPGRAQDVDLWKRMANSGMIIRTLPDVLYAWRK